MKHSSSLTLTINLLFWYLWINQCAKFNRLSKSFSLNWYLEWVWYAYPFNLLPVMRLNNDIDRSSLSQSAFTFGFFSNNVRALSTS